MQRSTKYLTAAVLVFCAVVIIHAATLLLSPLLAGHIEKTIGRSLDADVEIEGISISFFSGGTIDSFTIDPRAADDDRKQKTVRISGLKFDLSLASLISGRYMPDSITISDVEVRLDGSSIKWLMSRDFKTGPVRRIPSVDVRGGSLHLLHPALEKPVHVKNLRASGSGAGGADISGRVCHGNCENHANLNMNLAPSGIKAQIQAKDFDISSLPEISTEKLSFDPSSLKSGGKVTGSISAGLSFKARTLTFNNGVFKTADGIVELPSAGLSFDSQGVQRAWMRADAGHMDFELIKNFREQFRIYKDINARLREGRFNITAIARWSRDRGLDYEADVSVRDGSAYFTGINTEADEIEADFEVSSPGNVKIRGASGWVSDGKVELTGFLGFEGSDLKDHRLEFSLSEIRADKDMHVLMPENIRSVVKDMQIGDAETNGRIVLASGHAGLDLEVRAEQSELPGLPFTVSNPATRIKWNSGTGKVSFNECRGYINGGTLQGDITLKYEDSLNADFTFHGRGLPINSELLKWLDLDSGPWGIHGSYDVELTGSNWRPEKKSPAEALKNMHVQADLRNVSVHHKEHGRVADAWYGHLSMDNEGARFTDFRGDIFGAGFQAGGTIPAGDASDAEFRFESENIALDDKLYSRLPFGKKLEKYDITGQCEITAEFESFTEDGMPDNGNVSAVIHNMDMKDGFIASAAGTSRFEFSGTKADDIMVDGAFDMNRINLDRLDANRLAGEFSYDGEKLEIAEMKMNAYGGSIRFSDLAFNTGDRTWKADISPVRIDLESIFTTFGVTGRSAPSGSMRGQIELEGKGFDSESITGGGEILIARGILYDFPVLASVFSVLDLRMPRRSPITDAYGNFEINDGRIRIKDLLLTGGSVPMHLEGTLGLKNDLAFTDQKLELLVTAAKTDGILNRIPVVDWVKHYTVDLFRRLAMQVRVEGTAGDYEVKRLSSPVTKPVERMWSLMEKLAPSPPQR
ncbi:MAG: hypothetical protein ACOCP6_00895 [Desulfosalsimonas sp.]